MTGDAASSSEFVWWNGDLIPWEDAQTHVLTHCLHYGTGVFEGIRAYATTDGPALFRLDEHLRRLERSAEAVLLEIPFSREELAAAVCAVVVANDLADTYVRPIVFRGHGGMSIDPEHNPVEVAIAAWSQPPTFSHTRRGLRLTLSRRRRQDSDVLPTFAKTVGAYSVAALARQEARSAGFDEAILLNSRGRVAEAAIENLFLVRNGVLETPPLDDGPLPGITRDSVIQLGSDAGIETVERSLTPNDLRAADEIFCVSTAVEVIGVAEIDGYEIRAPGPVTMLLKHAYDRAKIGAAPRFSHWLTAVPAPTVASIGATADRG